MSAREKRFNELAGVPVHYAREPVAPYGTIGRQRFFECTTAFFDRLENCFADLWQRNPLGKPDVIVSAGAFVDKPGFHGRGEAFDLDALFWADRRFVTLNYPVDRPFYLAIDACLRSHFGTVLNFEFNAAHRDHLHLDTLDEPAFSRKATSEVKFLQMALTHVYSRPTHPDGIWGPDTEGAADAVLAGLGLGPDLRDRSVWLAFLDETARRGFVMAAESLPPVS